MQTFDPDSFIAVLAAWRQANRERTVHCVITVNGALTHASFVKLDDAPFTIMVLHPGAGIGPISEVIAEPSSSLVSGKLDAKLRIVSCDGDPARIGRKREMLMPGSPVFHLVDETYTDEVMDCVVEARALGSAFRDFATNDCGQRVDVRMSLMQVDEELHFTIVDLSTLKERSPNSARHQMTDFADTVHQGFFCVSESGELLYKSDRLDEIFGRKFETFEDFESIRSIGGAKIVEIIPDELHSHDKCTIDVNTEVSGENRSIRLRVHRRDDETGGSVYLGSAEDITAIVNRESELERKALTDPLTGVSNRRGLEHEMDCRLGAANFSPFAVLLCDLDGFKQVNDSMGHEAGDTVISEVGRRLTEASRDGDVVARLGGDEFVVIANNVDGYDEAMELAERILPWLRKPFMIAETQIELSGSCGVALAAPDVTTHNLLQMADHAMYEAKREGRNQAVAYHVPDVTTTISPLALRRDLRRAIAEDGLDLAFQPIYNINNLESAQAAEVLLRWTHPIQGHIEPSTMVTIAEQSGLIRELGEWIITESIRSAASVNRDGDRPISISVNVSALQVGRPEFVDMVKATLDFHSLSPKLLTIELTESYLIDRMDNAREAIDQLTESGVRLAVDDFGTGYSTFDYLLTLPVSAVKIDPSFTRKLTERRGAAMLKGLCLACRELDMFVVAEGIETAEQLAAAREAGVTHAQGYLLGMPVSTSSLGMRANAEANRVA